MRRLKRPRKPTDFESSRLREKWRDKNFISKFRSIQHDKCGYCETLSVDGDIDHYRPKGRIDELINPDLWQNYEYTGLPNLNRSRPVNQVRNYGYPWLSNDWNNYIYACKSCNSRYKRCLFPVQGQRKIKTNTSRMEVPLLLNPYGKINPADHILFNEEGKIFVKNNSRFGFETIITCGLNRGTLTNYRRSTAEDVYQLILEFQNAGTTNEEEIALRAIARMARDEKSYSGMVRNILENELGITLEELLRKI